MKKSYVLILISLSIFLTGCTATEQTNSNEIQPTTSQMSENDGVRLLSFFAPGYDTFEDMVDASVLIIRGRVLDERVENINVNITLEEAIEGRMEDYEAGLISRESRDYQIEHHYKNLESFEPEYRPRIFYRVEILEIFQGNYDVGDIIEIGQSMVWDEEGNPNLEYSERYEVNVELVLFLRDGGRLGYFTLHPHQTVYEVPADLDVEEDVEVILAYVEEFQPYYIEIDGTIIDLSGSLPDPFEITLEMLREIAKENDLLD